MSAATYPLPRRERKLHERVQRLLPADEEVRAAIVVLNGPTPGSEGFLVLVGALLGPLLFILSVLGLQFSRSYFTIALTNRGVVHLQNRTPGRPSKVIARYSDASTLGPFNEAVGDLWVELAGQRYWLEGAWTFESYRMRKLLGQHLLTSSPAVGEATSGAQPRYP